MTMPRRTLLATGSYQQLFEAPAVREHVVDVERALSARPGAVGAAVFVGPMLSGLDVFGAPAVFARQWRKLLRAHAVEAYSRPADGAVADGKLRGEVQALLAVAGRAWGAIRGNAGVGRIFEFRIERYRGTALAHEGSIVHAALL